MKNEFYLKVSRKTFLTQNALELEFEMPQALTQKFQFVAGQYITLCHDINGQEVRRSYSLCSTPSSQKWSVAIKRVSQGIFSNWAHDVLSVGDSLKVLPPEGRFTLETQNNDTNHYLAIAAGSGITPIMSMIQETLTKSPKAKFSLIYGNQNQTETMFAQNLNDLVARFSERFDLVSFFSREDVPGARFGRIDNGALRHLMSQQLAGTTFDQFFLCGPEAMIETAKTTLTDFGGTSQNTHYELFFSAPKESTTMVSGQSTITVVLDGVSDTFVIDKETPVLDAVLAKDLDPPYSCQGGVCSSCIARVSEGKATMIKNQILTDGEVEEGLVLTCQALVESDAIVIDYDNV